MDSVDAHLQRVYGASDRTELGRAYGQWAEHYDRHLGELGWGAPREAATRLKQHVGLEQRVLDVGAGTGLVGAELKRAGFQNLVALDLSKEMLEVARAKQIYQDYVVGDVEAPLPLESASFGAVVAVGLFTQGHAGPKALDELHRVLCPGGFIAYSLRPDLSASLGFEAKVAGLLNRGEWRLVEESPDLEGFNSVQTKPYRIWIYQRSREPRAA
jgi:ubiquinone/menaquinone biosynthesis C-methylase UbiE